MAIADDIRAIRTQVTGDLVAAHDYYDDTQRAWDFLQKSINTGYAFSYRNPVTGTITTQADLAARIPLYSTKRIAESTFNTFLAIFEAFFTDFMRAWLRAYPQNLLNTEPIPVDVVLESPDKGAITEFLIDRAIVGLLYKKPADWFAFIEKRLKLGCPTVDEIARFAEAKATRDILTHNRGVVNEVYVAKSGTLARYVVGEFIDVPAPYHRQVWELLLKIVADVCDAMIAKFP